MTFYEQMSANIGEVLLKREGKPKIGLLSHSGTLDMSIRYSICR